MDERNKAMDKINIEIVKKLINKILDIELNEDIKNGYELLRLCNEYEIININNKINKCVINNHKQKVLEFINNISFRYSNLINIYNILNSGTSSNHNQISCQHLKNYIYFLEKIKVLKEKIDNIKSYDELISMINDKKN